MILKRLEEADNAHLQKKFTKKEIADYFCVRCQQSNEFTCK